MCRSLLGKLTILDYSLNFYRFKEPERWLLWGFRRTPVFMSGMFFFDALTMKTLHVKYTFLTHLTSSRSRRQLYIHYRYHKSPLVDPNPSLIKFTPPQSTSCIMYVNMHIVFQSTPILPISWRNHFWNLHSTKWRERDCQNTRRHFPENNDVKSSQSWVPHLTCSTASLSLRVRNQLQTHAKQQVLSWR